jgi:hypothetical protein
MESTWTSGAQFNGPIGREGVRPRGRTNYAAAQKKSWQVSWEKAPAPGLWDWLASNEARTARQR